MTIAFIKVKPKRTRQRFAADKYYSSNIKVVTLRTVENNDVGESIL